MNSDDEHDGLELGDTVDNFPVKKKKKNRGKRKKNVPTGFEEYFADAPTTPADALLEQKEFYASSLPFEQRIQTCIHRFRTRRRLDSELSNYFSEYMFLGGVDTYLAPFSDEDLEEGSLIPHSTTNDGADDDEDATARFYDGNARHWTVDFAGVAAGFLSVSILPLTGVDPGATARAVSVVEAFLRYVLQHDVCPEHEADVREALAVCVRARDEWPRLWRFKGLLPGRFHVAAARTLGVHDDGADWSLASAAEETLAAEVVFFTSLVAVGEPLPADRRVVRQFTCSLALRAVEMPDAGVESCFRRLAIGDDARKLNLQPLGRAVFRPTVVEDGWVRQLPLEDLPADEDVVFLLERDLLEAMTLGMMMTATVCELSSGFRFLKTIETLQPSFYTFLPQHLIKDYKPPRANDRPPPSVHDGAAAAAAAAREGAEDGNEEGKED
ncbi:Argonaute complex, subunit Arb1 [Cordyceps fumosorosea ARSEF 2679]|uniref:Argonaute complex, subunit Arb1 n=1 Tax=Cordyceps fumosorosea (strain ARSEF 2679) TaxID=1081104 RepID=A0A162IER7_CORFA|nr:Argonaute complex, subunit Arb1 [Cordyceps fumosorosea ARSEF 2679]OAA56105.1 Argonaute complex, subunit Arb1 [Cordyceps fumosorosea ARSEF 2679]